MHRRIAAGTITALTVVFLSAIPATAAPGDPVELTMLSTTDVHGHVYNWDYFSDAEYTKPSDILGLTRVATVVEETRAAKGEDSVLVFDNGDAIQGTPLTYFYGMGPGAPSVLSGTVEHPMATAFNTIGYDAQVVGNHEYNYGLDMLGNYADQLNAPLLAANAVEVATGEPRLDPYTIVERTIDGQTIKVGVLGLVTPGVRYWDKGHVEGILEFKDMVASAKKWVPIVKEKADVVVVLAHTGQGNVPDDSYNEALLPEDVVNNIAYQVPGIDVIVAGHSHQDKPSTEFTNVAGEKVLVTQPNYWARSVTEVTLNLVPDGSTPTKWNVDWTDTPPVAAPHYGKDIETENAALKSVMANAHQTTIDYVNTTVATSTMEMSAATSRYEDTAILDFINSIQAETVSKALAGSSRANVPVLSQASPFSRTAVFSQGPVTISDIAALYVYENTLLAVSLTGAQLKDYLEFSARYFNQTAVGAVFDPETGTNAVYPDRPSGVPDYNYDVLSGVNYHIDISQPVGSRVLGLSHPDGTAVTDTDEFVLALNNYRQSGGGAYPHVATAPVVYDERLEIRQVLIEWAQARGTIDPAEFAVNNWWLRTTPLPVGPVDPPVVNPPVVPGGVAPGGPADGGKTVAGAKTGAGKIAVTGATPADYLIPAMGVLAAGLVLLLVARGRRKGVAQ